MQDKFGIDSAGTYGGHRGEMADARMRAHAQKRGYNITHLSRPFRSKDFEEFDMIIVMDDRNYEAVNRLAPTDEARRKIFRMIEFAPYSPMDHIPDPYYEGPKGFELVLDMLERCCKGLWEYIREQ